MTKAKTFLLMMADYSDFPTLFAKNLEKEGFLPYVITDNIPKFKYENGKRYINFLKKTFQKDREYKKNLVEEHRFREYTNQINALGTDLDYVLIIRPDLFPISVIKFLKTKTKKLIAYQWDGINKFPQIKDYFSLFDIFYCFEDVTNIENVKKITNFYFDFDDYNETQNTYNHDVPVFYFVGLDWENRREKIDKFVTFTKNNNYKIDFYIQEFEKNANKNLSMHYMKDRISFAENIELVKKSDILVDFVDPRHSGLSIRFFEGMYYKKKVITDNIKVKQYDFYHPDNIFVLENENYDAINEFLKIPYQEIPENIVKKYGFSNWIQQIIQH